MLIEAAINGKVNYLRGEKENGIMGRLVPVEVPLDAIRPTRKWPVYATQTDSPRTPAKNRWPSNRLR